MFASDKNPCDVAPAASLSEDGPHPRARTSSSAFRYPPVDPGFPAMDLDQILGAHTELLSRIKVCYGAPREVFERDVLVLVRRYAAFVHLLPATPANYFNEPGGLLRLGLETAFYALQGTDAHIFSGRATIAARRQLEPRWRLATFIAGLCTEIHRTVGQTIVTDHQGSEWPSYLSGLQPWLVERGARRYYLKWLPDAPECPGLALFALPHIVPTPTLQHLAHGNKVVVPHLMASLSRIPIAREHNILDELVRRSAALVIDRFLQTSADRFGKPMLGSHLERYLVDALRRLVATHAAWTPNAERSRIWLGSDGLFIVWPNAAADVGKLLEADQLPGVPKSPATMLEILLGAGVLQAQPDGAPLWWIRPPGAKASLEAVKLTDPAIVLVGLEHRPAPLVDALQRPPPQPAGSSASTPPPPSTAPAEARAMERATAEPSAPESHASPAPALCAEEPEPARTDPVPAGAPLPSTPGACQLELPVSESPAAIEPAQGPSSTEPATQHAGPSRSQDIRLNAPLRLAPHLRAALADILQDFNATGGRNGVQVTSDGLFIALAAFELRHVEPSEAMHALSNARMLANGSSRGTKASTLSLDGQVQLGLTVAPRFLTGWNARGKA